MNASSLQKTKYFNLNATLLIVQKERHDELAGFDTLDPVKPTFNKRYFEMNLLYQDWYLVRDIFNSIFINVRIIIIQHLFRQWLGAEPIYYTSSKNRDIWERPASISRYLLTSVKISIVKLTLLKPSYFYNGNTISWNTVFISTRSDSV